MKILLTGMRGQVGFELRRALAPLGEIVGVDRTVCDLADPDAIRALVRTIAPQVIVNAAAYTSVDKAESDRDKAFAVNAEAPSIFAESAARLGALLIHYSTDYVFDGTKSGSYTEDDIPNPQSVYGQSKFDGEQAVIKANPKHLILRSSWVAGAHGGNFAKTILRLAGEKDRLSVVADQVGAPTSAALLADITAQLLRQYEREGATTFPYGIYHLTANGETNWCDYARFIIAEALTAGRSLKATPESVLPIHTADYPTPAKRPANSRLNTLRFRNTFNLHLPHWQDGIRHVLQQIL